MEPTVAITGATTSGIGRAVAEAFVDEGAFVAVSGRDGDAVDQTVAALNESGDDGDGGRDEGEGERGARTPAPRGAPASTCATNSTWSGSSRRSPERPAR